MCILYISMCRWCTCESRREPFVNVTMIRFSLQHKERSHTNQPSSSNKVANKYVTSYYNDRSLHCRHPTTYYYFCYILWKSIGKAYTNKIYTEHLPQHHQHRSSCNNNALCRDGLSSFHQNMRWWGYWCWICVHCFCKYEKGLRRRVVMLGKILNESVISHLWCMMMSRDDNILHILLTSFKTKSTSRQGWACQWNHPA